MTTTVAGAQSCGRLEKTIQALDQAKRLLFALAFAAAYLPLVVLEFVLGHWSRQSDVHVSRGSPTANLLIHFRCRAASHQNVSTRDSQPGSPITFHDGHWAYCPAGRAAGCQWEAVAPISLEDLRRQLVIEEAETSGVQQENTARPHSVGTVAADSQRGASHRESGT
jgi:hypothetical protein